ncbi:hypothetical protein BHF71_00645 [Vulcanibacillus modesticaldus]|uniref:NodB homology domain-containing protein n=1 Tax=Vulcanibacillus modesticaldus TaxID=337097 RepID=A0A1D2YXP1_9BACI|nr:polysaccharide deacetylase family protein [Vulcanibacillus modesticaldus]OEG00449.1 hypothetical protein BHF71_00645 [Vulcanibacillus modesticaldus]
MKGIQFLIIISLFFLLIFGIVNSRSIVEYTTFEVFDSVSQWEKIVDDYANEHNIAPIEPKVDRIWKLIPGYNGLIVDKKATLTLIKEQKPISIDDIKYVWKEVEPKKKLEDLGAYPIYRGNPAKPMVSFMINVAWGTEYLDQILEILKNENVKATFFVDGSWLKKNSDLAQRIVVEGHEIGNHAYSHPRLSRLTRDRIRQEIVRTEELIRSITNQSSAFFAPPAGDYDQRVVEIANNMNLKTVLWTVDTIDWQKPSPQTIINRIIKKVDNGNLILMHPTKPTVDALPTLIKEIKKKGLKIGTVKKTLSTKRVLDIESPVKF